MNKKFIYFWALYTGVLFYLALRFYFQNDQQIGVVFGLCGAFGLFMIISIVTNHRDFKLTDNKLVIKQVLREERQINLTELLSWSISEFHFRGQLKRTVILRTGKEQEVSLTDKDDLIEFEKLHHHLKINFPARKE
jgi:hypothetical protein